MKFIEKQQEVTRTTSTYRAVCSKCGVEGPSGLTQPDAVSIAEEDGWSWCPEDTEAPWSFDKGLILCPACIDTETVPAVTVSVSLR